MRIYAPPSIVTNGARREPSDGFTVTPSHVRPTPAPAIQLASRIGAQAVKVSELAAAFEARASGPVTPPRQKTAADDTKRTGLEMLADTLAAVWRQTGRPLPEILRAGKPRQALCGALNGSDATIEALFNRPAEPSDLAPAERPIRRVLAMAAAAHREAMAALCAMDASLWAFQDFSFMRLYRQYIGLGLQQRDAASLLPEEKTAIETLKLCAGPLTDALYRSIRSEFLTAVKRDMPAGRTRDFVLHQLDKDLA
ncbi:hypothetical protein [Paludibacterium paludis]|uniref:Uncharacterized protein n=1 Tax=Paludibacterium paludis TaxID=1225769 RepID=A0A918P5D0_9NEIS|nr:hypothetical protein [Paludibacterium paludis]GGY21522.1 hypothetical protein GCM10011289_26400 [Paludibacterium paludis]